MGIYIILSYILRKYLTFTKKVWDLIFGNIELKGWAQKKCANEILCRTFMTSISWLAPCTLQHLICAAIPHLNCRHAISSEQRTDTDTPHPPQPSPGDDRVRRGQEKRPFSFYLHNFNATNPCSAPWWGLCICLCVRVSCNHCNNQTCSIAQIHPRPCNVNVLRLINI